MIRETMIVNSPAGMDLIIFGTKHLVKHLVYHKDERVIRQMKSGLSITNRVYIAWESGLNDKEKVEIRNYLKEGKGEILGEMSIKYFDKMFAMK